MDGPDGQRLGLGAVGQLLGVPRLTVWWWARFDRLEPTGIDGERPWWSTADVYAWALSRRRGELLGRVPLTVWPAASRPARYLDTLDFDGAIGQQWATDQGRVVVVWPLTAGPRPGLQTWVRQMKCSGHWAVVSVTSKFGPAPILDAILPGLPDHRYSPRWSQLVNVLGRPAPYWPSTLREAQLIREWEPDADTVTAMAVPALDTATLLCTAAAYPEGHPSSRVLVNLARLAQRQAADSAQTDLEILARVRVADGMDATLSIAAQPLQVSDTDLEDVDDVQRRAGWLDLLARTDTAAARCVREVSMWDGGADLPYSNPDRIQPTSSKWAREWSARLEPAPRTAAVELLTHERDVQSLVDPATDAPVVREFGGALMMAVPQRIPAQAPLAELILDGPIWVRTADGVLYPAPRDSYFGLSWGYDGSGPGSLALLIDALLNDITAKAPAGINGAPAGLEQLTGRSLPPGTVLTREQLEAARDGKPLILLVTDTDTDDEDEDEDGDDE